MDGPEWRNEHSFEHQAWSSLQGTALFEVLRYGAPEPETSVHCFEVRGTLAHAQPALTTTRIQSICRVHAEALLFCV